MQKKILCIALSLILVLSCGVSAMATTLTDNAITRTLGPIAGEIDAATKDDPRREAAEESAKKARDANIELAEERDPDFSVPNPDVSTHGLLKWEGKDNAAPYEKLAFPTEDIQRRLPKKVWLKGNHFSYNRQYDVALLDGNLYVRRRNSSENWRIAPMPDALKGKLVTLSIDHDEIIGLDENNWIYTCGETNKDTSQWYWITAWGELYKVGGGYQVRNPKDGKWAMSIASLDEDKTYTTIDGKRQPIGGSGCAQLVYIDPDDATKIYYSDPWLPRDESREIGTPLHSRFKVESLSASSSTTFVINKYGDMFTRLYDYDLAGGDAALFGYSWQDQGDKQPGETRKDAKYDTEDKYAKYRLPAPDWVHQPKIPGDITDHISVESTAPGAENRLLKVEGRKDGKTGVWSKMIDDSEWTFTQTDEPLQGKLLQNSAEDTSTKDLAPLSGINYRGRIDQTAAVLTVKDFAYNDSRQTATITVGKVTVPAVLYSEYGNLGFATTQKLTWHSSGFTDNDPRWYTGALEITDDAWNQLESTPLGRQFLKKYMIHGKIRELTIVATPSLLRIGDQVQVSATTLAGEYDLHRMK